MDVNPKDSALTTITLQCTVGFRAKLHAYASAVKALGAEHSSRYRKHFSQSEFIRTAVMFVMREVPPGHFAAFTRQMRSEAQQGGIHTAQHSLFKDVNE